ncbi:hypothetical protein [Streptomyces bauhiniae]
MRSTGPGICSDERLARHIRFGHRVVGAEFSTAERRWTVTAERAVSGEQLTFTARLLLLGTGYYDHREGFTPKFAGVEARWR